jgi:hypothetical protein
MMRLLKTHNAANTMLVKEQRSYAGEHGTIVSEKGEVKDQYYTVYQWDLVMALIYRC